MPLVLLLLFMKTKDETMKIEIDTKRPLKVHKNYVTLMLCGVVMYLQDT